MPTCRGRAGYTLRRNTKLALDTSNLSDAPDSDTDYFYASHLPGEPVAGVDDIHMHPTLPRTAHVSLVIGF